MIILLQGCIPGPKIGPGDRHTFRKFAHNIRENPKRRHQNWSTTNVVQRVRKYHHPSTGNKFRLPLSKWTAWTFNLCLECGFGGRDQRFGMPGRDGHSQDDPAQNQGDLREKPGRHENRVERAVLRGEDPGPAGQGSNHRRGVAPPLRHKTVRSPDHT